MVYGMTLAINIVDGALTNKLYCECLIKQTKVMVNFIVRDVLLVVLSFKGGVSSK